MLHTLIIAIAIVGGIAAVIAFLIFITKRQGQRKNQQLQDSYSALLAQHNLQPDYSQFFEHRIFAFDAARRIFVFVQQDEDQPSAVIDLADVGDCRLWKDGVQIKRKGANRAESVEEYISAVGLSFSRKSGLVMNVPVYTEMLDGIEQKIALNKAADQWLQRIKTALAVSAEHRLQPAM